MDDKQEFYDKLFEQPKTILGLNNKLKWLINEYKSTYLNHEYFQPLKYCINETYNELKRLHTSSFLIPPVSPL